MCIIKIKIYSFNEILLYLESEFSMDSSSTNIKVAIRIRPMLPHEIEEGYECSKLNVSGKEIVMK